MGAELPVKELLKVAESMQLLSAPGEDPAIASARAELFESLVDADTAREVQSLEAELLRLARIDPLSFNAYVLRDEETGERLINEPIHERWHQLLSENKRALIWANVDAGKTSQVAVGRTLWELGRNPQLRVAIISNTSGMAEKICRTIARYIEHSDALHQVFPDLRKSKTLPWTAHQLFVEREQTAAIAKDPSVAICGMHGNILGARIDLAILDDVLDYESTVSPTRREDTKNWINSTVDGRISRNGRIWYLGNVWDPEDHMHDLAKQGNYAVLRSSVYDENGELTQPLRWPQSRIDEVQKERPPHEFQRQVLCKTTPRGEQRFREEWLAACKARGDGTDMLHTLGGIGMLMPGERIFTGVDLGVRDSHKSAVTALFTILFRVNGDRQVLCCESGKWTGPEIVSKIMETYRRYQSIILVENVAAQNFILQFVTAGSAVPVRPFETAGRGEKLTNVNHPEWGFETMGVEMSNAKWIIPSRGGRSHSELEAWMSELLFWERGKHIGDRAMASWIALQGSRAPLPKKMKRVRATFTRR